MAMQVGIDVGGTFTDLIAVDGERGEVRVVKISSTVQDQSIAILQGLTELVAGQQVGQIIHGTTVATNAIIERKGAVVGLITTRGFRDSLELRRRDRETAYGLTGRFDPLVPRELRVEVTERTSAKGEIIEPVDEAEVREAVQYLLSQGAKAVVISFLHSYGNPRNELQAAKAVKELWPNDYVVRSSEILSEMREFERTSTAVVNGYVQPAIDRYLKSLVDSLATQQGEVDLLLVQSNGGVMSSGFARKYSAHTVLSGPAAGVVAAASVATEAGYPNAVSCDIGGTSLDIALIVNGAPLQTSDSQLGFGLPLRVSMIDIRTIGAGGGSIAWIDRAGVLRVGPQSAGSNPGPACYGIGGTGPTVTDANVLLGRIDSAHPVGIDRPPLDVARAREAIERHIATPLGLDAVAAAYAILEVSNHKVANSIRRESVERGYDPRDFALVAYGGAGPLQAAAVGRNLGFRCSLIPRYPGLTAALGCLMTDIRHDFVQTVFKPLDEVTAQELQAHARRFHESAMEMIAQERGQVARTSLEVSGDLGYEGQTHTIRPTVSVRDWKEVTPALLKDAFEADYTKLYGRLLDGGRIKLISFRCAVIAGRPKVSAQGLTGFRAGTDATAPTGHREVFFEGGFAKCPIFDRSALHAGFAVKGPAIVQQPDTTTVIEPGMAVRVDAAGNLIIEW